MQNDDIFEQTLCRIRRCYVYKIPPRNTGMGYRAAGWTNQIWMGSLSVVLRGKSCYVELIDDNKKVFASTMIREDGPSVIEPVLDSSRYFVMRIEKDRKKAYIGVGFQERSEALDFKIALQEYKKYLDEPEYEEDSEEQDYSLQEGETLHVDVAIKNKKRHNKRKVEDAIEVDENGTLAPPPETGHRRRARGSRRRAAEEEEAAPAAAPAPAAAAPASNDFDFFNF